MNIELLRISVDLPRPRSNALRADRRVGELELALQQTMALTR